VDATNGFREEYTDVHSFYLVTLHLLQLVRDSVGHDHLKTVGATVHEETDTCIKWTQSRYVSRCLWVRLWPDVCRSARFHRSQACLRPKVCGHVCPDVCRSVCQGVHGPPCVEMFVGLYPNVCGSMCVYKSADLPVPRCVVGLCVSISLQICPCPDVCGSMYVYKSADLPVPRCLWVYVCL